MTSTGGRGWRAPPIERMSSASHLLLVPGDESDGALRDWFDRLAEGGEIKEQLLAAPWGDSFGQLTDKFGVAWMFNIAAAPGE